MTPQEFTVTYERIKSEMARAIVGQEEVVDGLLVATLARGHVLVEGAPGLGKTLMVRALAAVSGCTFKRVQFTPDLMPSDITGSSVFERERGTFTFVPGPIFGQMILADEINRAPAKTQSSLLEAMQDRQVTVDGTSRPLPQPFVVIATQNPVESQGTYPLPEAQLDRFLMKLTVSDPPREVEMAIVKNHALGFDPSDLSALRAVTTPGEIAAMQAYAQGVKIDDAVIGYIVDLTRRTREDRAIELGASPRASIALLKAAQVIAASEGRTFVTPDDVKPMVKPVFRHRVMLQPDAQLQGVTPDQRIDELIKSAPVPRGGVSLIPTRRVTWLAWIAVGIAVFAGYVKPLRAPLLALDALVIVAALVDLLLVRTKRFEIERQVASIFSVGRANPVDLHLQNRSSRTVRGTVTDDPLPDVIASGLPAAFELAPHTGCVVRYEVTPTRRGPRELRGVTVRYDAPLGFVARQERVELPAEVDVYPDVHAARSLEMLRRQGRQDARLGSLRVRGGDTEFERLRPYQRGDEIRFIDWRASARRDDLTVRQFQAESNQNVVFALDIGRGMRGESGGLTSVDHALNAALLAADVALRGGDKAGLMTFDDTPRTFLRPTGGRTGARKLTRAVYALEAGLAATDYRAAMTFLQSQVRARSLLVVFTNLLDPRSAKDLSASVRSLVPRHLPLVVLMRDMDVEAMATEIARGEVDLYVRAAAAEALAWRDSLVRQLQRAGVLVLDARPGDVTPKLVKRYLEIKARRLL